MIYQKNCSFCGKMKRKDTAKRKEAFTADKVMLLMELLPEDQIGWSIRLMLDMGKRTQGLLALGPRHISEDGSSIEVQQAINMVKAIVPAAIIPQQSSNFKSRRESPGPGATPVHTSWSGHRH